MTSENERKLYGTFRKTGRFLYDYTGGKSGQRRVLMFLDRYHQMTQRDLQVLMEIKSSTLSEMLTKLENAHLIVKERSSKDQRVILLSLTAEGKKRAEEEKYYLDQMTDLLFENVDEKEEELLLSLLLKLNQHWDELKQQGAFEALERGKKDGHN